MLIIAGHATRKNKNIYEFPTVLLIEELCKEKISFIYLRHSIDGNYLSQLLLYKNGVNTTIIPLLSFPFISVLRYVSEIFISFLIGLCTAVITMKKISFIGIDPLNALAGILLRKAKIVKFAVFYSVDYTDKRFSSSFLNKSYLYLDSFSAKQADKVWNVSRRIFKLRIKQGIDPHKNMFIPNVPPYLGKVKKRKINDVPTLITLGILDKQLDYITLLLSIEMYKKLGRSILLNIVGNGPMEDKLRKMVKDRSLEKEVKLLGYMKHEDALKQISRSDIGLALYNGKWSFNYFGDSLKCREYFAYGLPVITTNTHSTVEDIKESRAGEVVSINAGEYTEAIVKIVKNYNTYSNNALLLGNKYKYCRLHALNEVLL